jgi:hypothetical protein
MLFGDVIYCLLQELFETREQNVSKYTEHFNVTADHYIFCCISFQEG